MAVATRPLAQSQALAHRQTRKTAARQTWGVGGWNLTDSWSPQHVPGTHRKQTARPEMQFVTHPRSRVLTGTLPQI